MIHLHSLAGDERIQPGFQLRLRGQALKAAGHLAVLEQQHQRQFPRVKVLGQPRRLIHVDLDELELVRVTAGQPVQHRRQYLARPAPRRIKIRHDGVGRAGDLRLKLRLRDVLHVRRGLVQRRRMITARDQIKARGQQTQRQNLDARTQIHSPESTAGKRPCKTFFAANLLAETPVLPYDAPMLSLEHLAGLLESNRAAAGAGVQSFALGGQQFAAGSPPAIMGVVNLSADSWYRESICLSADTAIQRGKVLAAQGAYIVDVGAESTLAHAARVDDAMQQSRLIPVIQGLRAEKILVSVETYSPAITRASLEAGANILNLTGTAASDEIFQLVAAHDAAVIICYVAGKNVREVGDFDLSADPIPLLREFFARQIETARRNGVQKIFLDPGLGFYYRNLQDSAVRVRHQLNVFLNTFRLRELGFPICHALPHAFEYFGEEVRCAEPFFAVLAALGKTDLLRTHEVPRIKAVLDTMKVY